jgi:hypothetical protein
VACVAEQHASVLSRTGARQPRVLPSWPAIRAACAYHRLVGRRLTPTHVLPSGAATGARRAPPDAAHTRQWLSHGCIPWRDLPWAMTPRAASTRSPWSRCGLQSFHGWRCRRMPPPAVRGTGPLGYQYSLGDGVGAEIAFLLHVRPHGV